MEVYGRKLKRSFHDTVGKSSVENNEVFCQPCSSDGDWIVAIGYCENCNEYLCANCLKVHRKQAISRNHKILEGENMPQEQVLSVNACSELCSKHTNEIVKFYCSSDDVIGCADCMVLGHKTCKVDRIPDLSRSYFNGAEHQDLQRKVNQFLQGLEQVNQAIKTSEKTLKQTYSKSEHDIKAFKKEVIDYLDKAEADMLAELNKRKKSDEELISNLKENEMSMRDKLQELHEKLQLQISQANELFVAAKEVKERINHVGDTIKQFEQDCHIKQYEFVCSKHVNDMLAFQHKLGELLVKKKIAGEVAGDEITVEKKKDISKMEPHFDCEIGIKASDDSEDCEILACALISSSKIALADAGNKCLKIVNIENRNLSARHELQTAPKGVTVVTPNCIAVTLPSEQKVQFLTISQNGNLSKSHDIAVNGECEKIDCKDDQLLILFATHVEIRNTDKGKVIKSISRSLFDGLVDIAFARDYSKTYYISSITGVGSLLKYDFDGNLIASYSNNNIRCLKGLCVIRDGTVLVCDSGIDTSIHIISPECKRIREILKECEHVTQPYCLSFCDETNKLFLCSYGVYFKTKLQNVLKIFQLK